MNGLFSCWLSPNFISLFLSVESLRRSWKSWSWLTFALSRAKENLPNFLFSFRGFFGLVWLVPALVVVVVLVSEWGSSWLLPAHGTSPCTQEISKSMHLFHKKKFFHSRTNKAPIEHNGRWNFFKKVLFPLMAGPLTTPPPPSQWQVY